MRWPSPLLITANCFLIGALQPLSAEEPLDVLQDPAVDWTRPNHRIQALARLRKAEDAYQLRIAVKAASLGIPTRRTHSDGRVAEIFDFTGDLPRYRTTCNANAAISSAASQLRTAPYSLLGSGVTVGIWDEGVARSTHQEFGGRITVKDGTLASEHSTHVCGTIGASGVTAAARGMASSATLWSYDWNSDTSEMMEVGATEAAQSTKIYVSNHSYGTYAGWDKIEGGTPYRKWEWHGGSTSLADPQFGRYNTSAAGIDSIAYNAPYFLPFWAAANDRTDNPSSGDSIALSPNSTTVITFVAGTHPPGDGNYRGGFETVAGWTVAKNIITIGSVADCVTSGVRDISKATIDNFSCWGPTDDGRIKPDLVANGNSVYSSTSASNTSYNSYSGTSMATPSACGSAALLIGQYTSLFPGQGMRASTLKALLIHTADDIGNPGPDYKSGWGVINVKAAADIIADHATFPLKKRFTETNLNSSVLTRTHSFLWDGTSPIRATLCWTDPAGVGNDSATDSRTRVLIRDLNLKVIAPDGAESFPYVMPYTNTWNAADMNATASTGINLVDPVEQVRIAAPSQLGVYQAVVSISSAPTSSQSYSLIISGTADSTLPAMVESVNPTQGLSGRTASVTLSGSGFTSYTRVFFQRPGFVPIPANSVSLVTENSLTAVFDLTNTTPGLWDVVVQNETSSPSALSDAFAVMTPLLAESFDVGTPTGWSSESIRGSVSWGAQTSTSHTPSTSYFAAGTNSTTTALISPPAHIPASASHLILSFWHNPQFAELLDGALLEYSLDGGASWTDALDSAYGTTVTTGGYNATITIYGNESNDLAGRSAWSNTAGNTFFNTSIQLSELARFRGKTIRFRWVIGTSKRTSSVGWNVDSISFGALQDQNFDTPNSLPTWRANYFSPAEIASGLAASNADPDADGISNLAEYALGLDPRVPGAMPYTLAKPPQQGLILSRPSERPNVLWIPQVSLNLSNWWPAQLSVLSPGTLESVQITPPSEFPTTEHLFLRVGFQEP